MPTSTTKTFDALKMSRYLRETTGRKLALLTREERLALLNGHIRKTSEVPPSPTLLLREEPPAPHGKT